MVPPMQHREVFREPGRFGGWPANYGLWAFGDEVGRSRGAGDSSTVQTGRDHNDRVKVLFYTI
jgi:hypothetical protein